MELLWISGIVTSAVSIVSSILVEEFIKDRVLTPITSYRVRQKVKKVVEQAFHDAIASFPGFQQEIDGKEFLRFLYQPTVAREIGKLTRPTESPDRNILAEEWERIAGQPYQGSNSLVIDLFLNNLMNSLWDIEELHDALHIHETHEAATLTMGLLPQIAQDVSSTRNLIELETKERNLSGPELKLSVKLDTCRELLVQNKPKAALSLLVKMEDEFAQQFATNFLRFRWHTLIGGCYLQLHQESGAIDQLKRAHVLAPDEPKAIANLALVALMENRIDDAIELARKALQSASGKDTPAPAVLTNALATKQNFLELDGIINSEFINNIDYVRTLGNIFNQVKDYPRAIEYYRLCLAQDPNDWQGNLNLAQVLINDCLGSNQENLPFLRRRCDNWAKILDEALQLVNTALEVAQKGDADVVFRQVILARANLHFVSGNLNLAKDDWDTILKYSPDNISALHNRGILAILDHDYRCALDLFSKIPEPFCLDDNLVFAYAKASSSVGEPDQALNLMNRYLEADKGADIIRASVIRADAWIQKGDIDEANKIKNGLLEAGQTIEIYKAVSFIAELQHHIDESVFYLSEAYKLASEAESRLEISLRFATLYYIHRDFDLAAEWFDKAGVDFWEDKPLARSYVQALYGANRYADTYRVSRQLREQGNLDPAIIHIEAWLAEYFGDLKTALELEILLTKIEPARLSHLLQCARLEYRQGNRHRAKEILETVDVYKLSDPGEIMLVAELYVFLGESQTAIEIAYRARYLGQEIPEIHIAYVSLFFRVDDDLENLTFSKIATNTAVQLVGDNTTRWVKIVSENLKSGASWEFQPDSSIGKLLVDHSVGDVIAFKTGPLENLEYRITEIQSLYVRALQETFEEYSTRFPDHPGIHKMQIINNDLSQFFSFLYQDSSLTDTAYKFYEQGAISVEQFSVLINRRLVDVYTSLQGLLSQKIYASTGTVEDQGKQLKTIQSAEDITLDITALLSMSYLELRSSISTRFKKIYISQALLDELEISLADRGLELKKGRKSVGFHEGRFFVTETPPDVIERNIQFLQELIEFCREFCQVIPIPAESAKYLETARDPKTSIGTESISSILVAHTTQTKLWADDAKMRQYAEEQHKVMGFWTQTVLMDMENRGIIDRKTYISACARLLEANYHFTAINENLILDTLDITKSISDHRMKSLLKGLYGPSANEESAIPLTAKLLARIWLSALSREQKMLVMDQVLPAICHGRSRQRVVNKLIHLLKSYMVVTPVQRDDLVNQITLWSGVMHTVG